MCLGNLHTSGKSCESYLCVVHYSQELSIQSIIIGGLYLYIILIIYTVLYRRFMGRNNKNKCNMDRTKNIWSSVEDAALLKLVQMHGTGKYGNW